MTERFNLSEWALRERSLVWYFILVSAIAGAFTYLNLGPIRQDVGAIYDLASHDISICNFLLGGQPAEVSANAAYYVVSRGPRTAACVSDGRTLC